MALCGVGLSGNIVGQTMANPEHEKLLKRPFWVFLQKEDAWNRWRKARPDVVPDLHRTFLHQRDLHGYDFSELICDTQISLAQISGIVTSKTPSSTAPT
jgi:hypothetical protein